MARLLGLLLAVAAGAFAAVLLASDVSTTYAGETVSCTTVISAAAVDPPVDSSQHARLTVACHEALVDRTELSGLAVLVCVAAGTGWGFAGREAQPA